MSSSERLVHWKRKPRSRMVWRKGDLRLAVSSVVDDAAVSISSVVEKSLDGDDVVALVLAMAGDDRDRVVTADGANAKARDARAVIVR